MAAEKENNILSRRRNTWDNEVTNPTERQVFQALSNPQWNWRTTSGLARESGLPEISVQSVISKHARLVRKWPYPDQQGQEIISLVSESVSIRERLARLRKYLEFPYRG